MRLPCTTLEKKNTGSNVTLYTRIIHCCICGISMRNVSLGPCSFLEHLHPLLHSSFGIGILQYVRSEAKLLKSCDHIERRIPFQAPPKGLVHLHWAQQLLNQSLCFPGEAGCLNPSRCKRLTFRNQCFNGLLLGRLPVDPGMEGCPVRLLPVVVQRITGKELKDPGWQLTYLPKGSKPSDWWLLEHSNLFHNELSPAKGVSVTVLEASRSSSAT